MSARAAPGQRAVRGQGAGARAKGIDMKRKRKATKAGKRLNTAAPAGNA
jgi:hypothetical protein